MSLRKISYGLFSVIVFFGIFAFLLQHVTIGEVLDALKSMDKKALLVFLLLSFSMSVFRTWRYQILLRESGESISSLALFFVVIVRNFFSDLLPARLGTLIYVYIVNNRLGAKFSSAASSFALAFLFDIIALAPLVILATFLAGVEVSAAQLVLASVAIIAICAALIAFLPGFCLLASKILRAFGLEAFEKLATQIDETRVELKRLGSKSMYLKLFVISLFVRLSKYSAYYFLLYALLRPFDYTLSQLKPWTVFLGFSAAELSASLPISGIGGFGAYEGAWALAFTLLGFPQDLASLTAISHHLFTQVYGYSLGAVALVILLLPIWKWQTKSSERKFSFPFAAQALASVLFFAALFSGASAVLNADQPKQLGAKGDVKVDRQKMRAAKKWLASGPYRVVFDSNISGSFGIYMLDEKGNTVALADSPEHEVYPASDPNGKFIVYGRTKYLARNAPADIWILEAGQKEPRLLVKDGTFPTVSKDGKRIFFERKRRRVMMHDLETGKNTLLFPKKPSKFRRYTISKPRLNADESWVAFTSDRGERWTAYAAEIATGEFKRVGKGCEPTWFEQGFNALWVVKSGRKAGSGFGKSNLEDETSDIFFDKGEPYGHEYFPTLEENDRYLLHSACPPDEHAHETSNYELFVKDFESGDFLQLTQNGATNRWAKLTTFPVPAQ